MVNQNQLFSLLDFFFVNRKFDCKTASKLYVFFKIFHYYATRFSHSKCIIDIYFCLILIDTNVYYGRTWCMEYKQVKSMQHCRLQQHVFHNRVFVFPILGSEIVKESQLVTLNIRTYTSRKEERAANNI